MNDYKNTPRKLEEIHTTFENKINDLKNDNINENNNNLNKISTLEYELKYQIMNNNDIKYKIDTITEESTKNKEK